MANDEKSYKIVFCTTMYTDPEENISLSRRPQTASGHIFQKGIVDGLIDNGANLEIVNIPRVGHYPDYPRILFNREPFADGRGVSIGFINLPGIYLITQTIGVFKRIAEIVKSSSERNIILITYNTLLPQSYSAIKARKKWERIRILDIVCDMNGAFGVDFKWKGIKKYGIGLIYKLQSCCIKKFDLYVMLTKYMRDVIGVGETRSVVIEGIFSDKETSSASSSSCDTDETIIFYAGSLNAEYDIEHLLKSFSLINDSSYRLWIAGDGSEVSLVKDYATKDSRINYLGVLTIDDARAMQSKATILVSPRKSTHEYTKYSFPSKTIECLASGKPYVAHILPCDLEEYMDYIQYANDESDEALAEKLVQIAKMTPLERLEIGKKGRNFIINNKNAKVQCQAILNLIESYVEPS